MAAIKMQPLVVDMGGEGLRKFASDADFEKVAESVLIMVKGLDDEFNGLYRAVSSANDVKTFSGLVPEGGYRVMVFVRDQQQTETGELDTTYAIVAYLDADDIPYIKFAEIS